MRRIIERGQIEARAGDARPRVRLPDRERLFAARAERLRDLGGEDAIGHSIADYLMLMASLADAQHAALASFDPSLTGDDRTARARRPSTLVLPASGLRDPRWRDVLARLCSALDADAHLPPGVAAVLDRLDEATAEALERQADAILAARHAEVDAAAAPFVTAALQVCWTAQAGRLPPQANHTRSIPGVCPVCGALPVASIVREDSSSQGHRFLHCALCSTEWHLVRITCSHCQSTQGISYRSLDGGPESIRAECCDRCRTYRKILYQEKDAAVDPVADDLASITLDLLLAEAGYHRASGNPLLFTGRAETTYSGPPTE